MSESSTGKSVHDKPEHALNIDFDDLAKRDPDWAAISKSAKEARWLDFQGPKVVRQLTKSILKCNFNLSLALPEDRLCPPVPVRWNYIRWLQELLDTTSDAYSDRYDPEREVFGLDIGTGASAIYALLGCSTRPNWRMAGTDVDQHSLDFARQNVEANGLEKKIKIARSTTDSPLIPLEKLGLEELDFVMTNPPFYSSKEDMEAGYASKHAAASAANLISENEAICPGGDIGFVTRIFEESLVLREKVQWYTAMLGKLSSLQQIVAKLKENDVHNYAVMNLTAGHRTKRWAVAWSFQDLRPRNDIARHGDLVHAVLPSPTAQTIAVPLMSAAWAGGKVDATLKALDVRWQWRSSISTGVMEAKKNVWSRAARRRKKFDPTTSSSENERKDVEMVNGEDASSGEDEPVALAAKVICKNQEVDVRWLRGFDHVLFGSFCGMLKRSLTTKDGTAA